MNYFKKNLKYLNLKKKYSHAKLGEMSGVNQSTITRWISGTTSPTLDNLLDLSRALNISVAELTGIDLEEKENLVESSIDELKNQIRNLPDSEINQDGKESLISMVDTLNKLSRK